MHTKNSLIVFFSVSGIHFICPGNCRFGWQSSTSDRSKWKKRTEKRKTKWYWSSRWSWLQCLPEWPWDWTLLCWERRDCQDHPKGSHSRVYSQKCWKVPLHLCHTIFSSSRGNLWGKLWKILSDHLQATSFQWDCEEVLQASWEGLQWSRSWAMPHTLWIFLHNQVHWGKAWYICWRHPLREVASWDLRCWLCHWGGSWGVPR